MLQGMTMNRGIKQLEDLPEGKCEMLILCRHLGDETVEYDPRDKKSLEAAEKKMHDAVSGTRRMIPVAVGGATRTGAERVSKLDPTAKGHILTTPISGG